MVIRQTLKYVRHATTLLLALLLPAAGYCAIGKSANPSHEICFVVDAQGRPVTQAAVMIEEETAVRVPEELKVTTSTLTDNQGRFVPPIDVPDSAKILIKKEGYTIEAFTASRQVPERIVLKKENVIRGKVLTENGKPVDGALLGPIEPAQYGELGPPEGRLQYFPILFARSGRDGSFSIEGLHPQSYRFTVSGPAFQPRLHTAAAETTTAISVRTDGTTLTGYLMGSRDGTPKAGIYVQAMAGAMELYCKTDAEGQFVFPCLPPLEWSLRAGILAGNVIHPSSTVNVPGSGGELQVNLTLNQGARLSGRVIDADTSAPLPLIPLNLVSSRESVKEGLTDSNGYFAFDVVDAYADLAMRFDERTFTYVSQLGHMDYVKLDPIRGEDVSTITLVLTRRAQLAGRILSPAGKPLAGAAVTIAPIEDVMTAAGKSFTPTETAENTGADGTFEVGLYPPGKYSVSATFENLLSEPETIEVAGPTTTSIELKLRPGVYLSGLTVNSSDRPVSGSVIKAYPPDDAPSTEPKTLGESTGRTARPVATATSGFDGSFSFRPLLPQRLALVADHPDYARPADTTVHLDTMGTSTVKLVYASGNDFSAVVKNEDGQPVRSAEVRFFYMKDLEGRAQQRETDEDGRVAFRGLATDKLERVAVHHPDYTSKEIDQVTLPQEDYPITLERRATLVVTVESNAPILTTDEKFGLLLFRSISHPAGSTDPPQPVDFTLYNEARPVEGKGSFSNLEPGWYKVALRTSGMYVESDPFRITTGLKEITLRAENDATLRGRVTEKKTGQSVAAATVSVEPLMRLNNPPEPKTVATTDDGHYEINGLSAGTYKVVVHHDRYPKFEATVALRDSDAKVYDIALFQEMASLSGKVTYGGSPVKNALIVLAASSESESPVGSALTGDDGAYMLPEVPVGSYILSVEAPVGSSDETSHKGFPIRITGASLTQDVAFERPTTVRGRVTVNGRPAGAQSGATSLLFMPNNTDGTGRTAEIKPDGTFETQLEPGTYSVGLEDRPGKDISIPKSDTPHRVTITF